MEDRVRIIFSTFIITSLVLISSAFAAIQISIKDPNGVMIVGGVSMSGCGTSGSTETCYYYQPIPCGVSGYQGQVVKEGAPSVWTPLYWNCLCGNGKCEAGETQTSCPSDCKTYVTVSPPRMYAGDNVIVTVYFNDSSYTSGRNAKIALYIDDKNWTNCAINGAKWVDDIKWNKETNWSGQTSSVKITSMNSYAKIEFTCTVPSDLTSGTHKIKAVPALLSKEIKLSAGETDFGVIGGLIKFLKSLFS